MGEQRRTRGRAAGSVTWVGRKGGQKAASIAASWLARRSKSFLEGGRGTVAGRKVRRSHPRQKCD
eukprot:12160820-Prorocentrum_lima.AAC.1